MWKLDDARPIYLQLVEEISRRILIGTYAPGEKIPSVRELASEAGVNPNTMQKALSELELMRLLRSERTAGRYVTEDRELILSVRQELAKNKLNEFLWQMRELGLSKQEILSLVSESEEEEV